MFAITDTPTIIQSVENKPYTVDRGISAELKCVPPEERVNKENGYEEISAMETANRTRTIRNYITVTIHTHRDS